MRTNAKRMGRVRVLDRSISTNVSIKIQLFWIVFVVKSRTEMGLYLLRVARSDAVCGGVFVTLVDLVSILILPLQMKFHCDFAFFD